MSQISDIGLSFHFMLCRKINSENIPNVTRFLKLQLSPKKKV